MLGINVFAARTDREPERLLTSLFQAFITLRRGTPGPLRPPVESMDGRWSELERAQLAQPLSCAVVGSPASVALA